MIITDKNEIFTENQDFDYFCEKLLTTNEQLFF